MQMDFTAIDDSLTLWLTEDIGTGDATSTALIPRDDTGKFSLIAREPITLAGLPVIERLCTIQNLEFNCMANDGESILKNMEIGQISGNTRTILSTERLILNLLQHLSGIATITARYVRAVAGTNVQILDTRKTTPGLRLLEKYAVTCGGGVNHRMGLDDAILIKDNHLAAMGGDIISCLEKARKHAPSLVITVECDTLEQVEAALNTQTNRILLDNMSISELNHAVKLRANSAPHIVLEASGGVTLATVREIAETGIDAISVGAITHSATAVDIGLDVRT